ncbi:MAG: TlpA family protein disulfide reductase [Cyclobacteriaceae bacterium]|jgi:thiol-disulfide isomerase/thioredoxin|nr:TlpA family protein disulfide reductase [Cyclobacteriaceae bacterium]
MNSHKIRLPFLAVFLVVALLLFFTSASKKQNSVTPLSDSIAYSFALKDLQLQPVQFDIYKGKVVLINLWATWCGPCREEMPYLQKLYETYSHPDFEIVAISLDKNSNIDKVKSYLAKNNFTFPVFYPAENFPKVLQVPAIPSSFLIDRQGRIVWQETGVENFSKQSFKKRIDALINLR